MQRQRANRIENRGANLLEFTLVGIPIIFILISVFEISRGMWLYQTAAHASREAARFIVVHGSNCQDATDACGRSISEIGQQLQFHLVGLDPNEVNVTFRAGCAISDDWIKARYRDNCSQNNVHTGTLQSILDDTGTVHWPGSLGDNMARFFVEVELQFPFRSAIAMFWPGAGRGMNFGTVNMFAGSRELFQF